MFPATKDTHALVQLQTDVREGCLPYISLFEFTLNALTKHSSCDFEEVLHSSLGVLRHDLRVLPYVVQSVLGLVYQGADLAQVERVNLRVRLQDLREVGVDKFRLLVETSILL